MQRSLFAIAPFRHPKLGDWLSDLWSTAVKEGPAAWKAYQSAEKAEDERKAAEAARAAAQAAAQAQAATAQAQAQTAQGSTVAGIPMSVLLIGGIGIVALGVILFAVKK